MIRTTLYAALVAIPVLACEKSAQQSAQEMAQTRESAEEKAAEALREADRKTHAAQVEAQEKIDRERAKVEITSKEFARNIETSREDLRKNFEEELGRADKKVIDLKTKLATAKTPKVPKAQIEASIKDLQDKVANLRKGVAGVRNTTELTFDSVKSDLNLQLSQLKKSIDEAEAKF